MWKRGPEIAKLSVGCTLGSLVHCCVQAGLVCLIVNYKSWDSREI